MNKKDIVYRELNSAIKGILLITEGWLVGNSLHSIIHGNEVTDYDIIVPSRELFQKYIYLISSRFVFSINSYGGIKIDMGDFKIDMWCEELSHFIESSNKITYLYNHKRYVLLENL
tara:strand:+ start:4449 stop:4796 length:348 start_codon:yes stop_codon:yes gene_type:complete